ncbi:MAG: ABC transporter ATP-binding protein [Candidatus Binatia bacterium]|nr:ABC transporter ATP-binding protein [Candidatus Binatia bacterium]
MIRLEDISLTFPGQGAQSLREKFTSLVRSSAKVPDRGSVTALREVNIDIRYGQRVGVIGLNGAGKTTLLKVMCGIYPVTSGRLTVEGDIACLFEIATGFEMEATGWENIITRGLLVGLTRREIRDRTQEIADFTELGAALDRPVKTYSAGMFIRLAFAVSTSILPDVLLLDEVVAAGDQHFQDKATRRLQQMVEHASILVLVSHSMDTILTNCTRVVWIEAGRVRMDGPAEEVVQAYTAE